MVEDFEGEFRKGDSDIRSREIAAQRMPPRSDSQPQNRISTEDINRTMLQLFRQYLLTMDK